MSLSHQIDIIANIDTTGFKADTAAFSEYLGSGASDGDFAGKDRRISFVQNHGTCTDFSPGAMQRTGDPLDAAIDGKGYFVVQTPRGQRYTRNGAFGLNATGQLVTSTSDLVLGTTGPINFQPTDHDIIISTTGVSARDGSGTLSVQRGQLQLVDFDNAQQLQKDGASTFQAAPKMQIRSRSRPALASCRARSPPASRANAPSFRTSSPSTSSASARKLPTTATSCRSALKSARA